MKNDSRQAKVIPRWLDTSLVLPAGTHGVVTIKFTPSMMAVGGREKYRQ